MDNLEKTILKYLMSRPPDWTWGTTSKTLDKETTIEKFRKDKKFRKFIIEQAHITAIEMFEKASEQK